MTAPRAMICSYGLPQPDGDSGTRRVWHIAHLLLELGYDVEIAPLWGVRDDVVAQALKRDGFEIHASGNEEFVERIASQQFDLALLVYWPVAEWYMPLFRKHAPTTRVLVDSVDLHCLREARRIYRAPADRAGHASLLQADYGLQMIGELNVYAAADGVMTVSEKEARMIGDLTGDAARTFVVADCEDFRASPLPFDERRGIVMVGSYNYPPNVEAAEFLCRDILPKLPKGTLERHPLYIVGQRPGDRVRAAAKGLPNVQVVGWVPSVEPYFERCRISVVPLLYGAGTKRKLVQSLMAGTPTVTTSVGAEGLNVAHEQHVLLADDASSFAHETLRLLRDETLWTTLSHAGRELVLQAHGGQVVKKQLATCIARLNQREPKGPLLPESNRVRLNQRVNYQQHSQIVPAIIEAMEAVVPLDASVVIVSEGGGEYLRLGRDNVGHFPQGPGGFYVGNWLSDAQAVVKHLEDLRHNYVRYIVFPGVAFWWLTYYKEFAAHLETHYPRVAYLKDKYAIFNLRPDLPFETPLRTVDSKPQAAASNGAATVDAAGENVLPASVVENLHRQNGHRFEADPNAPVRLIAFYLPQFHPIPENDLWWGEGFTEWTNVSKAQPLFDGHYQPHIPADLGYCDLRSPEVRRQQAELARDYGVHGFCYYHYWFQGKRLLERPFNDVLASGEPDFPFCLCWANEPWSRRWNGSNQDVLQPQSYSNDDDRAHIRFLLPALSDRRAITVDGKPMFIVYQAKELPDPASTVAIWREEARRGGLAGLHLVAVETGWDAGWDATKFGFDAKVLFQPQFSMLFNSGAKIDLPGQESLRVYDYEKAWPVLAQPENVSYRRYSTVFPSWDNAARTGRNAVVVHNATPEAYRQWLTHTVSRAMKEQPEHRIVFLNAWNEWGEGCHLEPDLRHGRAFLEATREAVADAMAAHAKGHRGKELAL